MEKAVITREALKSYPKNKTPFKAYHKFKLRRELSARSIDVTVKLLYKVMVDSDSKQSQ